MIFTAVGKITAFHGFFDRGNYVVIILAHSGIFRHLQVVLFGDQHGFQSIQGSLLVFIRDKNTAFFAIKSTVDTGHSTKFAENVPDIGFAQTLVIDKGDGKVAEFVSLDVGGWSQAKAVILAH